jgi:hypothetical protein
VEVVDKGSISVTLRLRGWPNRETESHISQKTRDMGHPAFVSVREVAADIDSWGQESPVQCCGIPHLAKNKRDMGHPAFVIRMERWWLGFGGSALDQAVNCQQYDGTEQRHDETSALTLLIAAQMAADKGRQESASDAGTKPPQPCRKKCGKIGARRVCLF